MKKETGIKDIGSYQVQNHEKIEVRQYGLDGKYINTFESITEAGKTTKVSGSSIWLCINNKGKSAGGFQWKKL